MGQAPRDPGAARSLVGVAVTVLLGLTLGGLPASVAAAAAPPGQSSEEKAFADRVLALLNRDRAIEGLAPLRPLPELNAVAQAWSEHQAAVGRMYHNPDYISGYPSGWQAAGENVAYGYRTAEAMYQGWYNSPGHHANMFSDRFTHVGIGIAFTAGGTPYGTQNFAAYPGGAPAAPAPTAPSAPSPAATVRFFLNDGWDAEADHVFGYGRPTDQVLMGDWDGDGRDTIAVRRGNQFHVSNAQRGGTADRVITYGRPGDVVLVGDWDGDGVDTFAVRRGAEYHVKNSVTSGPADRVVIYGRAGDTVLVGDWDGDGDDTLAVRRGAEYHIKNTIAGGRADRLIHYGRAADTVLVGDWDGDRADTLAVRRGNVYHVKNALTGGEADIVQPYGRTTDEVYVGDWNGDRTDTLGVRRLG